METLGNIYKNRSRHVTRRVKLVETVNWENLFIPPRLSSCRSTNSPVGVNSHESIEKIKLLPNSNHPESKGGKRRHGDYAAGRSHDLNLILVLKYPILRYRHQVTDTTDQAVTVWQRRKSCYHSYTARYVTVYICISVCDRARQHLSHSLQKGDVLMPTSMDRGYGRIPPSVLPGLEHRVASNLSHA
jgi:hypothetical protein